MAGFTNWVSTFTFLKLFLIQLRGGSIKEKKIKTKKFNKNRFFSQKYYNKIKIQKLYKRYTKNTKKRQAYFSAY